MRAKQALKAIFSLETKAGHQVVPGQGVGEKAASAGLPPPLPQICATRCEHTWQRTEVWVGLGQGNAGLVAVAPGAG